MPIVASAESATFPIERSAFVTVVLAFATSAPSPLPEPASVIRPVKVRFVSPGMTKFISPPAVTVIAPVAGICWLEVAVRVPPLTVVVPV